MQKPIANVFTWPADDPELLGGQCKDCGAITFPVQSRCPRCGTQSMAELPLPRRGTLVSWTTQEFPPSSNYMGDPTGKSFEPFGIGLVQLDDVVRVERGSPSAITQSSTSEWRSCFESSPSIPTSTRTRSSPSPSRPWRAEQ